MKKSVLAAALAGVMLLSGCSGVSQDEYNSLLEENSSLKENNSSSSESTSSETSSIEESSTSETNTSKKNSSTESSNFPESGSSDDNNSIIMEKIEKGEIILSPYSEAIWAFDEEVSGYITSVGIEPYLDLSDDDKIKYSYLDASYFASDKQFADKYSFNLYWYNPDSGNVVGYCTIYHLFGDTSISDNCVTWANEWEQFNEFDSNKKYIEIVENLGFNGTDGNFELDGYKVNITGEYEFSVVDNQFSEDDGTPVIKIAAAVENVSSKYDFCMLYCTITDPNGDKSNSLDSLFDDGIMLKKIGIGSTFKGYFVIPYTGDGEYKLEFRDLVSEKYVYKIDVTKP